MAKKPYTRSAEAQARLDDALDGILTAFAKGDLAKPLAQVFLNGSRWADRWGVWNKLLVAINGASDAATLYQWRDMGRRVVDTSGKQKIWLMAPMYHNWYKPVETDSGTEYEKRMYIKGFRYFDVYAVENTEPDPDFDGITYNDLYDNQEDRAEFIRGLPLVEVADTWGIKVGVYGGKERGARGWMLPGSTIQVGVANLSTWAHELIHEADYRLGHMNKAHGQDRENEIVAELGGAVLLTALGLDVEADWGGAYEYVASYAHSKTPEGLIKEVRSLVWRISDAVKHILETAATLEPAAMEVEYA